MLWEWKQNQFHALFDRLVKTGRITGSLLYLSYRIKLKNKTQAPVYFRAEFKVLVVTYDDLCELGPGYPKEAFFHVFLQR